MDIQGKTVGVLAENNYQDMELWYPVYRFREAGASVYVIGSGSADRYYSKHGYQVTVDAEASKLSSDHLDALIIPGGYAPDSMRTYPAMVNLVKQTYEAGQVVAAICHAGWMLVSANILSGVRATSYHAIKDDMINAGAKFVDEPVVRDGNLITSRIPDDLPVFCHTVLQALSGN